MTEREFSAFKFTWLSRVADSDLPALASRLAIKLADKFLCWDNGGIAYMAQSTLAELLGVRRQTVSEIMSAMVRSGLLSILEADGRTNAYIMGGISGAQSERQKLSKSSDCARDLSEKPDISPPTTCPQNRTGREERPVGKTGQLPVRKSGQDHVRKTGHKLRVIEHREIELRKTSSFQSDVARETKAIAEQIAPLPFSEPELTKPATSAPAAKRSHGLAKESGNASASSGETKATQSSLPGVESDQTPKARQKSRSAPAGRSGGHDPELAAAMRELRQIFPAGTNTPVAEEGWRVVKDAMRTAHQASASYDEILGGVRRYAAFVALENPQGVFGPRNFIRNGEWRKGWEPRAARANGHRQPYDRATAAQFANAAGVARAAATFCPNGFDHDDELDNLPEF